MHVYPIKVDCLDGPQLAWLCDCRDMEGTVSAFYHCDLRRTTAAGESGEPPRPAPPRAHLPRLPAPAPPTLAGLRRQHRCVHSLAAEKLVPRRVVPELRHGPVVLSLGCHRMATLGDTHEVAEGTVSVAVEETGIEARAVFNIDARTRLVTCATCSTRTTPFYYCAHVIGLRKVASLTPLGDTLRFYGADDDPDADAPATDAPAPDAGIGSSCNACKSWKRRALGEAIPAPAPDEPYAVMRSCYHCRRARAWLAGQAAADARRPTLAYTPLPRPECGGFEVPAPSELEGYADAALEVARVYAPEDDAEAAVHMRDVARALAWAADERFRKLLLQIDGKLGALLGKEERRARTRELERQAAEVHERVLRRQVAEAERWLEGWRRRWLEEAGEGHPPWRLWLVRAALSFGCRHCVDDPVPRACGRCGGDLDDDPVLHGTTAATTRARRCTGGSELYCERGSVPVAVYHRRCLQCLECEEYDGKDQGVFNHSGATLYHERVLRDYWDSFHKQHSKTALAYWHDVRAKYAGGRNEFVSRVSLRWAGWVACGTAPTPPAPTPLRHQ